MYAKGRKEGTVRFALTLDGAPRSVCVAGDFNHWTPAQTHQPRWILSVSSPRRSRA